jgi:F0F1-type ATP synthase membrane subunit b/b'
MRARKLTVLLPLLAFLAMSAAPATYAQERQKAIEQEEPNAQARPGAEGHSEPGLGWGIANFVILVGFLGYLVYKSAPAFYRARTERIQGAIAESGRAKREADERVAEMERRIAGLGAEIENMRAGMRRELAAEGERIRKDTERHLRRIQEQAEQEIDLMTKSARRQLQLYAAELALKSAREQLPARITGDVENRLVESFVQGLHDGAARSAQN